MFSDIPRPELFSPYQTFLSTRPIWDEDRRHLEAFMKANKTRIEVIRFLVFDRGQCAPQMKGDNLWQIGSPSNNPREIYSSICKQMTGRFFLPCSQAAYFSFFFQLVLTPLSMKLFWSKEKIFNQSRISLNAKMGLFFFLWLVWHWLEGVGYLVKGWLSELQPSDEAENSKRV